MRVLVTIADHKQVVSAARSIVLNRQGHAQREQDVKQSEQGREKEPPVFGFSSAAERR